MASVVAEDEAGLERTLAELLPDLVHGPLGGGLAGRLLVDEIGGIGKAALAEIGDRDAEKTIFLAVRFLGEQGIGSGEDAVGELGGIREAPCSRPQLEVGRLELQRHRGAGDILMLETEGDALRLFAQDRPEVA